MLRMIINLNEELIANTNNRESKNGFVCAQLEELFHVIFELIHCRDLDIANCLARFWSCLNCPIFIMKDRVSIFFLVG